MCRELGAILQLQETGRFRGKQVTEPSLLQPALGVCGTMVEGWADRVHSGLQTWLCPWTLLLSFLPSSLHWPQGPPPALGVWPAILTHHGAEMRGCSWDHGGRQRTVEDQAEDPRAHGGQGHPGGGATASHHQGPASSHPLLSLFPSNVGHIQVSSPRSYPVIFI